MKRVLCILMVLLLTVPAAQAEEATVGEMEFQEGWDVKDNHRVFYEIFVGSFSDSNGDGIGDLRGIINRMDYLNDGNPFSGKSLGVEGIWLTPVFLSPSYHKYDVTDYYQIDPTFGTMEDLQELINLCHERDVKLILDLVLNHTGRDNEWYLRFLEAHKENRTADRYYDWYTWYPDGETLPAGGKYMPENGNMTVEANFSDRMPELNYDNPLVRKAALDIGKHYLEMGVDGFRFDAAKYIYLNDHQKNAAFWEWYVSELKKINPEIYTVAEVWDTESAINQYEGCMNCFRYSASQAEGLLASTAKGGNVNRFTADTERYLTMLHSLRTDAMNIFFLSNHDMDRAAGYLTAASGYMQMAANLYILGPGSPFIYYGEEIGMKGSRGGAQTDANRRLAFFWGDGDTVKDPTGTTYPESSRLAVSASEQMKDENSLYNYYKKVIAARRSNPEIAFGDYTPVYISGTKAAGFTAAYNGTCVTVLHNPSGSSVNIDLDKLDITAEGIRAVLGLEDASLEGGMLHLGAQTSVILK